MNEFFKLVVVVPSVAFARHIGLIASAWDNECLFSGHGGDGFLKFQDAEEISNVELADAFEQMWQKKRYHEVFFMIDTCQAESMFQKFYSPNILAVASSRVGEDSLSVCQVLDPSLLLLHKVYLSFLWFF